MRYTKIVATLGPSTNSVESIHDLVDAGVDVFRLNFSHDTHESHGAVCERIRAVAADAGRSVAVLQDLGGPKIRTGGLVDGQPVTLRAGEPFTISTGEFLGTDRRVSTVYEGLAASVKAGDVLLLDDGHLELRVVDSDGTEIQTTVVDGGVLGGNKGINAPGVRLPDGALTEKDRMDLAFGATLGFDMVAVSFVRRPEDLEEAREALRAAGRPGTPVIAKLERPEAFNHIDGILRASDAVMVARGDLGLEMPLERVPQLQKTVTRRACASGVPVILATQVLESMRFEPRPTRAEVSDAANAVDDGVDAIMLAGETAAGKYPIRAVQTLDRVIREAETILPASRVQLDRSDILMGHGQALCASAVSLATGGEAAAIVAVTRGGETARVLSAFRPRVPVFAATDQAHIARRLALLWGVVPVMASLRGDVTTAAEHIGRELVAAGAVPSGAIVVLVSISSDLAPGPSNFLKLQRV